MARVPETETDLELLVNCKTYPAVSKKYVETVCTGGVQADGQFVRLYPVPFRLLDEREQYERWDIIRVRAYRDTKDQRPESWHLCPGTPITVVRHLHTDKQVWEWMHRTVFASTEEMAGRGLTNGCVKIEPLELYWAPDEKEWSPQQLTTLQQSNMFATKAQMAELAERVPWQFRLKLRETENGQEHDAKVLAWSYYQGLRRALREKNEREALESVVERIRGSIFNPEKTVFAIFGTHSRFKHWMISSLYHLPTEVIERSTSRGGPLF